MGAPSKVRPAVYNPRNAAATRRDHDPEPFSVKNDFNIWLRIAATERVKGTATPATEASRAKSRFRLSTVEEESRPPLRINLHMENEQR
jgi:hypothetical protein